MFILLIQVDQFTSKKGPEVQHRQQTIPRILTHLEGQKSDQEFSLTVHLRSALVVEPPPRLASCSVYCAQQWDRDERRSQTVNARLKGCFETWVQLHYTSLNV